MIVVQHDVVSSYAIWANPQMHDARDDQGQGTKYSNSNDVNQLTLSSFVVVHLFIKSTNPIQLKQMMTGVYQDIMVI